MIEIKGKRRRTKEKFNWKEREKWILNYSAFILLIDVEKKKRKNGDSKTVGEINSSMALKVFFFSLLLGGT